MTEQAKSSNQNQSRGVRAARTAAKYALILGLGSGGAAAGALLSSGENATAHHQIAADKADLKKQQAALARAHTPTDITNIKANIAASKEDIETQQGELGPDGLTVLGGAAGLIVGGVALGVRDQRRSQAEHIPTAVPESYPVRLQKS